MVGSYRQFVPAAVVCLLVWIGWLSPSPSAANQTRTKFIKIYTGDISGLYYPTGGVLSHMVNRPNGAESVQAVVESTGGSIFNLRELVAQEHRLQCNRDEKSAFDYIFALVQTDRLSECERNSGAKQEGGGATQERECETNISENNKCSYIKENHDKICMLFILHDEIITLIAAGDSHIKSLSDLEGKRVGISPEGSGPRRNALDVLKGKWKEDYDKKITVISERTSDMPSLLLNGKIDAFFYTVGHPNKAVIEATSGRKNVLFISIQNEVDLPEPYLPEKRKIKKLKKYYPHIKNNDEEEIKTYKLQAAFVTSCTVDNTTVYEIVKSVFENLGDFKRFHPAFEALDIEKMTNFEKLKGIKAHPGALNYYREIGIQ